MLMTVFISQLPTGCIYVFTSAFAEADLSTEALIFIR